MDSMQTLRAAVEGVMDLVDANEAAEVARETIVVIAAIVVWGWGIEEVMMAIMMVGKKTEHANATIMVAAMAAMSGGLKTEHAKDVMMAIDKANAVVELNIALNNAIGKGDNADKKMEAFCTIMTGLCKYLK